MTKVDVDIAYVQRVGRTLRDSVLRPRWFSAAWLERPGEYMTVWQLLLLNSGVIAASRYVKHLIFPPDVDVPAAVEGLVRYTVLTDFSQWLFPLLVVSGSVLSLRVTGAAFKSDMRGWQPALRAVAITSGFALVMVPVDLGYDWFFAWTRTQSTTFVFAVILGGLGIFYAHLKFYWVAIRAQYAFDDKREGWVVVMVVMVHGAFVLGVTQAYWLLFDVIVPEAGGFHPPAL